MWFHSSYHLAGASPLPLDVGYLLTVQLVPQSSVVIGYTAPVCVASNFMENRWETVETVTDFIFLGSKITADGDCSHEIKRCLLLGRKAITNLDSILKSRDITLPTTVHLVKPMVLPVVMYRCESWTIMEAKHWKIDAFKVWCWRRLLRVSWTARRSSQSILKEISPEYHWRDWCEAETPILWPPSAKNWLIWKDPDAGKDWRWEEKEMIEDEVVAWHHWLNGHEFESAPGVDDGQGILVCWNQWSHRKFDMNEQLKWTDAFLFIFPFKFDM